MELFKIFLKNISGAMVYYGLQLLEGGDFYHKFSCGALNRHFWVGAVTTSTC
jgi:hypothetical protein